MSRPAAAYTPALSTKNDFGSAVCTVLRGSVRGSGASTVPLGLLESAGVVLGKLTGTICARHRQQRREKHKHSKYCDASPTTPSRDFHEVLIAHTVPVPATRDNFQGNAISVATLNLAEGTIASAPQEVAL
jgi:hypothetical protein